MVFCQNDAIEIASSVDPRSSLIRVFTVCSDLYEPRHEKTNNVDSDQV